MLRITLKIHIFKKIMLWAEISEDKNKPKEPCKWLNSFRFWFKNSWRIKGFCKEDVACQFKTTDDANTSKDFNLELAG